MTKILEELDPTYLHLLQTLLPKLYEETWIENSDVQNLYRTTLKRILQLYLSRTSCLSPPTNWTKPVQKDHWHCGCPEICLPITRFLEDPNKQSEHFVLWERQSIHLLLQDGSQIADVVDVRLTSDDGGMLLTKTNAKWKKTNDFWR